MSELMKRLDWKAQRGSKPRCHYLTHGSAAEVAHRLTDLTSGIARVRSSDRWMPQGFDDIHEAQLDRAPRLLDAQKCKALESWWFAQVNPKSKSPNIDIASTCTIDDEPGLLLVEAKAHVNELDEAEKGKLLRNGASENSKLNHEQIRVAMNQARIGLERATSLSWRISRDCHYQMSNRFAWAWKLTELGVPVVLVYLGFLGATDMKKNEIPFATHADWERLVQSHSAPLFPAQVWGQPWMSNHRTLFPLIKSIYQPSLEVFDAKS